MSIDLKKCTCAKNHKVIHKCLRFGKSWLYEYQCYVPINQIIHRMSRVDNRRNTDVDTGKYSGFGDEGLIG